MKTVGTIKATLDGKVPYDQKELIDAAQAKLLAPHGSECIGCTEEGIHIFRRLPTVESEKLEIAFAE
jgi:hypothetical protein